MKPLYSIVVVAWSPTRGRRGAPGKFSLKDLKAIEQVVREEKGFDGFSIAKLTGFWMCAPEECVDPHPERRYGRIKACAEQLRTTFRQESVLLTRQGDRHISRRGLRLCAIWFVAPGVTGRYRHQVQGHSP